jgi:hypothetical protein
VLTADQLRQLKAIHRHEFDRFTYIHDIEKWKTPDYWISLSGYEADEPWHYVSTFDPDQPWPHVAAAT